MLVVEALYEYSAQRDDELSFKVGDLIMVTDRSDNEWWKGKLQRTPNSPDALFPARFVRIQEA